MTDLYDHEPKQFYFGADTEYCPHKPIPERHTDAWDEWMALGHQAYDDGILCLAAPCGIGCPACSAESGDMVPWSRCENRPHTPARTEPRAPRHRALTVEVGSLECWERECDEFFTEDGDEIPGKTACSHLTEMEICAACSEPPVGNTDNFPAAVAMADCPQMNAADSPAAG
ncbi:hypothetical protein [Streptomyces tendae]|uniref:hypothetical protein n=1 Tax=Streptomyces tendae TaxID=1932 RepID=UPI00365E98E3